MKKLVKESIEGIHWSGKDPTRAEIIGKLITKPMSFGEYNFPSKEYDVVEIVENGTIYIVNSWHKPGIPQLIHKDLVQKYIPSSKDKLIDEIMNTIYKDDDPKYDYSNVQYLKTLSIEKLQDMLDNWKETE